MNNNIFAKNYEIEGHDIPMPDHGVARFFALLFSHFWKFIGVNILFVIFALPVFTLPASLCALNRVLIKLVRDGNVMAWQEFLSEFKADFLSSLLPGLLFGALISAAYFFIGLASINFVYPVFCLIFWSFSIFLLLFGICIGEYFFVMKAELDLPFKDLMKNSVILSLSAPLVSLSGFVTMIISVFATAALMPLSVILIFFFFPVMTQYILCFIINNVVQKKIIGPYEQMRINRNS